VNRLAIVYIRQSSQHQVLENRESRERQYALADFATGIGWSADRVMVIDEDQGLSGKFSDNRNGFQRLLAEVALDHVGLVLGLELSRLARSCKDWHHLVEVCAVFDTLLYDQDGFYDANDSNDRLLLGMKGAMSEFELITMRNRLLRGRENKAQRGEYFSLVPIGYVKLPSGEIALEPDEQARAVMHLIFDKFEELGTARGVFLYLICQNIRLGFRCQRGPNRGNLEWRRPTIRKITYILHHPLYAGAYGYPLHQERRRHSGVGRSRDYIAWLSPEQMHVFLPNRYPAYITLSQYQAHQQRLRQNRSLLDSKGSPRCGEALLSGLVICGACNRALSVSYKRRPRYNCTRYLQEGRKQTCYGLQATALDALVAQQVLRALEPASIELSLRAVTDIEEERKRLDRHWKQRLERARYESERAERQYRAVDPDNRLVARTLESGWEKALTSEREVQEEYDRFLQQTPRSLSDTDRAKIGALTKDITALWHAPRTTFADRKEIVRCLVDGVIVHVHPNSERVDVTIRWHGGFTSQHEITRAVRTYQQLRDYDRLMDRMVQLYREGHNCSKIAAVLRQEGFKPLRKDSLFPDVIKKLLVDRGVWVKPDHTEASKDDEWLVSALARRLQIAPYRVHNWIRRGWVHSRPAPGGCCLLVWADLRELKRLEKLKNNRLPYVPRRHPALTVPGSPGRKK
jgi:DNA invertase Pin-like site-specific DNA recombinase